MRKLVILLTVSALFGCTSQKDTSSNEPNQQMMTATDPDPQQNCAAQIAAWEVSLRDFRELQQKHAETCSSLNKRQVDINDEYLRTKTRWPISIDILKSCVRENPSPSPQNCWNRVDFANALSSTDSNILRQELSTAYDSQVQLLSEAKENQCSININSTLYDDLNISYETKFNITLIKTEPAKPTCAGGAEPSDAMGN